MNIGIIGAGRVGFSIGRFLAEHNIRIVGYYDTSFENAAAAADFTKTDSFCDLAKLVALSDTLFITVPDGAIETVWDCIKGMSVSKKIICHFSGSLSSDVFSGAAELSASVCSVHPMLAFNDRYSSYKAIENAFFTVEGDNSAVSAVECLLQPLGCTVCHIDKQSKALYHTAASILSNHMVALLDLGYSLLQKCGFSREEAVSATSTLVMGNVRNVLECGCVKALTGPIERGDYATVEKHLNCLDGNDKLIYQALAQRILSLSEVKNKDSDYSEIKMLLNLELTEDKK